MKRQILRQSGGYIGFDCSPDIKEALQDAAFAQDITLSQYMRRLLRNVVEDLKNQQNGKD